MRVIPPDEVTNAVLTSSTALEPGTGEAVYSSGTTYAVGDNVILGSPSSTVTITIAAPGVVSWSTNGLPDGTPVVLTTTGALPAGLSAGTIYFVINRTANTFQLAAIAGGAAIVTAGSQSGTHTATAQVHRLYESLINSNIGNPPAIDGGTRWLDIGPTNKWAMFDLLRNTGTALTSPLTVVITPGMRINSIALVGLIADQVHISATSVSGGGAVYDVTTTLRTRTVVTWSDYFFKPFSTRSVVAYFDLPPYSDTVVTVSITRSSSGYLTCGGLIWGTAVYVGRTLHDAESDAQNFSTIDRDTFGTAILIPRRSVPLSNQTVRVAKTNVPKLLELRESLNAKPAFWSGIDDQDSGYFPALQILGVYKGFKITMDQPEEALAALQLEEV